MQYMIVYYGQVVDMGVFVEGWMIYEGVCLMVECIVVMQEFEIVMMWIWLICCGESIEMQGGYYYYMNYEMDLNMLLMLGMFLFV